MQFIYFFFTLHSGIDVLSYYLTFNHPTRYLYRSTNRLAVVTYLLIICVSHNATMCRNRQTRLAVWRDDKETITPSRIALVIFLTSFRETFGERTEIYLCLTSVECRIFGEHFSEVFASWIDKSSVLMDAHESCHTESSISLWRTANQWTGALCRCTYSR